MIKKYVKWRFSLPVYLQEGILYMKNKVKHLQKSFY